MENCSNTIHVKNYQFFFSGVITQKDPKLHYNVPIKNIIIISILIFPVHLRHPFHEFAISGLYYI